MAAQTMNITDRQIIKTATIPAPIDSVWKSWSTNEGIAAFLEISTNMKLERGGPYEWYFDNGNNVTVNDLSSQTQTFTSSADEIVLIAINGPCRDTAFASVLIVECGCTDPQATNYNPNASLYNAYLYLLQFARYSHKCPSSIEHGPLQQEHSGVPFALLLACVAGGSEGSTSLQK